MHLLEASLLAMGVILYVARERERFPAQSAARCNLILVVRHVTRHHLLPENRNVNNKKTRCEGVDLHRLLACCHDTKRRSDIITS